MHFYPAIDKVMREEYEKHIASPNPEISDYWDELIEEIDPHSPDDIGKHFYQKTAEDDRRFYYGVNEAEANLVLNLLDLLLCNEENMSTLRSLALYVFTGAEDSSMTRAVAAGKNNNAGIEVFLNNGMLPNMFLLDAQAALLRLKAEHEKYVIRDIEDLTAPEEYRDYLTQEGGAPDAQHHPADE